MPRPYKPLAFANEFICKSQYGVDHMKLQKLTYCAYGWWLAYYDDPILNEAPQVWKLGPVFKSMYFALSKHGWHNIATVQTDNFVTPAPRVDEADELVHNLISWTWERYGQFSAEYLSDLTHQPGTPWSDTAKEHGYRVPNNTPIPVERIRTHYRDLAKQNGLTLNPA